VNRDQLIQALRKHARKEGKTLSVDTQKGKGSHYRVTLGGVTTTVQQKLNPGRIDRVLKQLGLARKDI
jgi:hypothetical protein